MSSTGATVGNDVLVGLTTGEGVPLPFDGVGTDPPLPLLSVGAFVLSSTGATVGGGILIGLATGEDVMLLFDGVGEDTPLPLLSVGTFVVSSTGASVGFLVGLTTGEGVPPPFG